MSLFMKPRNSQRVQSHVVLVHEDYDAISHKIGSLSLGCGMVEANISFIMAFDRGQPALQSPPSKLVGAWNHQNLGNRPGTHHR